MGKRISAIGIKKIFYGNLLTAVAIPYVDGDVSTGLSAAEVKAFLSAATTKEVKNVHQDTWNVEMTEATITKYKNQLTKRAYRQTVEPGDETMQFSIGQYDFETKADFEGGVGNDTKWAAANGFQTIEKTVVALTEDDVYIVYPKAEMTGRSVSTDGAIAIAVSASPMEPDIQAETKAMFYKESVDAVNP